MPCSLLAALTNLVRIDSNSIIWAREEGKKKDMN